MTPAINTKVVIALPNNESFGLIVKFDVYAGIYTVTIGTPIASQFLAARISIT